MPKFDENLKKILYYDRKNHRYVLPILRLLAEKDLVLTSEIARQVKSAKNIHGTKLQLKELARLEYCNGFRMLSNKNHVCEHCNKSTDYLATLKHIDSALETLANNRKLRDAKRNESDFDPKNYFGCKEGHVLGRLVWLDCKRCGKHVESHLDEEYKITGKTWWKLTENCQYLFLTLYKNNKLWKFIIKNRQNKVFGLIDILHQNHENTIVQTLINKLKQEAPYTNKLWKIVNPWYNEIVDDIFDLKYGNSIRDALKEYLKKYHPDSWEDRFKIHR